MTTPADNTAYSILNDAYLDAGLIQQGESAGSEQIVAGMRRLRSMINLWQTQGIKLWLLSDQSITLVANQATYTLSPTGDVVMTRPLQVVEAYYLDSNDIRYPLTVLSWDDFIRLGQVDGNAGAINSYFVQKLATEMKVRFWLTPDATAATGTAHLLLRTQASNPVNLTEEVGFPPEWRNALHWGLADELCTGQPQSIMDRCERRATAFKAALEDWDVEDAPTSFQPDSRSQYAAGNFR